MPWTRRLYRGNKVWVETGDDGAPVLDARGLAKLRYKVDDPREYSVKPSEVLPIEDGGVGTAGPAAHVDLVEEIRAEMRDFKDLRLVKVEGHAGVEWNERADRLATDAIKKHRSR